MRLPDTLSSPPFPFPSPFSSPLPAAADARASTALRTILRPWERTMASARRNRPPSTSSVRRHSGFWKRSAVAPLANSNASVNSSSARISIP